MLTIIPDFGILAAITIQMIQKLSLIYGFPPTSTKKRRNPGWPQPADGAPSTRAAARFLLRWRRSIPARDSTGSKEGQAHFGEERSMSTYPMDPVDAAWYHIDGPANLAMVTAVVLTKQPLDFDRVREVYRLRLAGFDRFRQRVVETGFPLATPHWQDMPHFDIDQHLHRIALPAPARHGDAEGAVHRHRQHAAGSRTAPMARALRRKRLRRQRGDLALPPLHRRRHRDAGGGAQGIRCDARCAAGRAAGRRRRGRRDVGAGPVLFGFDTLERAARRALALAVEAVADPQRALEKLDLVLGGTRVLLSELLKPADPKSPFKGDFGLRKHVAWSTPVAMTDVKAIGAPLGAKVNDVLVAAMTGALRTYLKGRGVDVNHTTVRAMVPVDLRPPERVGLLGNDFGLVLLDLPVAAAKAADRLAQTKARMDRLKRSPEPVAMKFLFELFGSGPKAIQDLATSIFGSKASLVMTNVVGPKDAVYLAGVPVDQMLFWVPHPGKELGVGISILSYRGMASLAVIADAWPGAGPGSDHRRVQPRIRADAARGEAHAHLCRCRRAAAHARHYAKAKTAKTRASSALSPTTPVVAGNACSSTPTPALVRLIAPNPSLFALIAKRWIGRIASGLWNT